MKVNKNFLLNLVNFLLICLTLYLFIMLFLTIKELEYKIKHLEKESKKYSLIYDDYVKMRKKYYKVLIDKYNLSEHVALKIINVVYKNSLKFDLNSDLIFKVIAVESSFDTVATSPADAKGLMQVLPSTANFLAGLLGIKDYNLYSIEDNILLGTFYLKLLIEYNEGDTMKALREYYAGRFWYLEETKKYALKVLNNSFFE